jgi:8-oxo-dGTP pyrophosphatase MutT (NUDIX family)
MAIEHKSCGVIPVRQQGKSWECFLVKHHQGYWALPKGHQEVGETDEQTARRELAEETGITDVKLSTDQTFQEEYTWRNHDLTNHKVVKYFLGLVTAATISIQKSELADGRWVPLDEAELVLTFPEAQEVFRQARKILLKGQVWPDEI